MSGESTTAIQRGQVDLLDFINWSGVECLNQAPEYRPLYFQCSQIGNPPIKEIWLKREDDSVHLESDADEQRLIYIPFLQVVKLFAVAVEGPEDEGPKTVKLFANKEHMGFSNVNDYPANDTLELSLENLQGRPIVVKYVKFQNVRSLTIFIEDNQSGADITQIQKIALFGSTVETMDMKGLKRMEDH